MIEKAIASALEPIVDEVIKLERKLKDIELLEGPQGPAGEAADHEVVAQIIVEKHADILRGKDGIDAPEVDIDALAGVIVEKHADILRGKDGENAPEVDVDAIRREVLGQIVLDDIVKQMVEAHNDKAIDEINAVFN